MLTRLMAVLVGVTLFSSSVRAEEPGTNAAAFYSRCQLFMQGANDALRHPTLLDATDSGICIGYFVAFAQHSRTFRESLPKGMQICWPEKGSIGQFVKVFVRFIDRYPQYMHRDMLEVAYAAMVEAFPCGK